MAAFQQRVREAVGEGQPGRHNPAPDLLQTQYRRVTPVGRPELVEPVQAMASTWDDDIEGLEDDGEAVRRRRAEDAAEAAYRARILRCRQDPNAFIEDVFTDAETGQGLKQAWFHRELQAAFRDPAYQYGIYVLPRDHGKTTQVEGYALWALGNNPDLRVKIVCASDAKAKERLFTIIQHLETNKRLREIFPWLKPASVGDWTKHKIVVERDAIMRDASVEALGVTSTATGGRADLLIADDVVDRRNALELPKLRENIKTAWNADWVNLLEPGGQVIYICTLWHTADLTHQLLSNPSYRVLRYDIGDGYEPLWPEHWPADALRERRAVIGQREFDRGFRNVALSGELACVRPEWVRFWSSPPNLDDLAVFIALDLSTGQGSDYTAFVVVGIDVTSLEIFALSFGHGMLSLLAQTRLVEKLATDWHPDAIGVEAVAYQATLLQHLESRREVLLPLLVPLKPRVSKALRLQSVTPYLEQGRVWFNPAMNPLLLADPLGAGDLITELTQFPLGAHDDLVDAFVYAIMLGRDFVLEGDGSLGGTVGVTSLGGQGSDKKRAGGWE